MTDHTPTPWTRSKHGNTFGYDVQLEIVGEVGWFLEIQSGLGSNAAQEDLAQFEKNVGLIIRDHNSHDALVEALERISVGAGEFSLDHHQHCKNCLEDAKETARAVLKQHGSATP